MSSNYWVRYKVAGESPATEKCIEVHICQIGSGVNCYLRQYIFHDKLLTTLDHWFTFLNDPNITILRECGSRLEITLDDFKTTLSQCSPLVDLFGPVIFNGTFNDFVIEELEQQTEGDQG